MTRAALVDALYAAAGFGLGGALSGALLGGSVWGWGILGATGGAALGLRARDRLAGNLLAIAGGVGFFVGFFTSLIVVLTVWDPPASFLFIGGLGGAIGGGAMGLTFRNLRAVTGLALAGGIGFALTASLLEAARVSVWNAYAATGEPGYVGTLLGLSAGLGGALVGYALNRVDTR